MSRLPFRLNIAQFACCLQCSEETARRYLRANRHGVVTKRLALGAPWKINPSALDLFGVDQELARELLTAAGLMPPNRPGAPGSPSMAAPSPAPSPA